MRAFQLIAGLGLIFVSFLSLSCTSAEPAAVSSTANAPKAAGGDDENVTGPYTHQNLAVFLIHGTDRTAGHKYITLQEALEQKKAIVHETGNVNELAVENVSDDDVYIQCGEIVKGGQQDRTLGTDIILTKAMGKMPIASFCVEHGRWTGRPGEQVARFESSSAMVAGAKMKLASNANYALHDQSTVWASVSEAQQKLAENAGQSVTATNSPSSLQLTLESKPLVEKTAQYEQALSGIAETEKDAIGWAYAVNGKLSGANVYASHELFRKLWPKLLKSASTEAFAESNASRSQPDSLASKPVSVDQVKQFLRAADEGKMVAKDVNSRTRIGTCEVNDCVTVQTDDPAAGNGWVHRSYLMKEATAAPAASAAQNEQQPQQAQPQEQSQQRPAR